MNQMNPETHASPLGQTEQGSEFASLLDKEFKPKSDRARDEVEFAVKTLAEQALSSAVSISDDAVATIEAMIAELPEKEVPAGAGVERMAGY